MIAAIRIRGRVEKTAEVKNTLHRLRLRKKHVCVLLPEKKEIIGMLNKVKDFITYGEIDKETLKLLLEKRAKAEGDKSVKIENGFAERLLKGEAKLEDAKIKPFFRLNPPRKGFERAGIKKPFTERGVLGYRGEKINELIRRML